MTDQWAALVEQLARSLYEEMMRRVVASPDWNVCGWDVQPEDLRADWRAVAIKAWDLCHGDL